VVSTMCLYFSSSKWHTSSSWRDRGLPVQYSCYGDGYFERRCPKSSALSHQEIWYIWGNPIAINSVIVLIFQHPPYAMIVQRHYSQNLYFVVAGLVHLIFV